MAERKVLIKYYPPDYEVSKIPRLHLPKNRQTTVRIMLPMSIQCKRCGEYIYKGKKFNGMKEEAPEHKYLTIKVWRFYFKCPFCLNEVTFLTDPKNSDYIVEHGATRNTEIWKVNKQAEDELNKKRKEEEKGDIMKQLENKTSESKREMEIADAIEEVRERNSKGDRLGTEKLLQLHVREKEKKEEEDDWEEAKRAFQNRYATTAAAAPSSSPSLPSSSASSSSSQSSHIISSSRTPRSSSPSEELDGIEIAARVDDKREEALQPEDEEEEQEGDEDVDPAVRAKRRELRMNGLSFVAGNKQQSDKPLPGVGKAGDQQADAPRMQAEMKKNNDPFSAVRVVVKRKVEDSDEEEELENEGTKKRKQRKKKSNEKKVKSEEEGLQTAQADSKGALSLLGGYNDSDDD